MKKYLILFIIILSFCLFDELFTVGLAAYKMLFYTIISALLGFLLFSSKSRFLFAYILIYGVCAIPAVIVGVCNDNAVDMKMTLLFNSALLVLFFLLVYFVRFKVLIGVICALLALPALIYSIYFSFSGAAFGADAFLAVLETTPSEASEYLSAKSNIFALLFILFYLAFVAIFVTLASKLQPAKKEVFLILSCLIFAFSLFYKNYLIPNIYTNLFINVNEYKNYLLDYQKNAVLRLKSVENLKFSDENGTFVVIIGESANKEHFSAFNENYKLTTPFLNELKKEKNAIFFSAAHSNHTHTTPTLTYALSAKNQYNNIDIKSAISIIELANKAGFNTFWLSAQPAFGVYGSPVTLLAKDATNYEFSAESDTDYKLDIALADILKKQKINGGKNLIFIHTMGSHWRYNLRYSSDFSVFGQGVINEYDNSIFYTDFVLGELFKISKTLPDFKAFIYFSDHGELPGDGMHDSNNFSIKMAKIPFFAYFSDDFVLKNQKSFNTLKSHKDELWTNDLLFNLLNSLLKISSSLDEIENDISNEFYDTNKSRFRTLHGKEKIYN